MQSSVILEVGAGYGRIVNGIKHINQQAHIDAIERNQLIFNALQICEHLDNVTCHNQDVFDFLNVCHKQYDLVLLLWSTLAVFSATEQYRLLERLKVHLNSGGKFVIDSFLGAKGILKPYMVDNYYQVTTHGTSNFGYLCPKHKLLGMAK